MEDALLASLGAPRPQLRFVLQQRAADRRGLPGPAPKEGEAPKRRPLPPLPPEVRAARDALATQDVQVAGR